MKTLNSLLAIAATLTIASTLAGCPKETIGGKLDDALDNRPAEKVQDAAEDVRDDIKRATK